MFNEAIWTIGLYALVTALALFGGLVGLLTAALWISFGLWLVNATPSRGWIADASFVVTWPFYVALGR